MNEAPTEPHSRAFGREAVDLAKTSLVALPLAGATGVVLWQTGTMARLWPVLAVGLGLSLLAALWVRFTVARRLRTVASVLAAFREGDFSIRARSRKTDGLVDEVLQELNALGDTMREHRLGEMEAWALLRKVMSEVDVVVLAFDDERRLKLANDAAAKVLEAPANTLIGQNAEALGLGELFDGEAPRVVRDSRILGAGPWELRRGSFRLSGEPHALVVLADVKNVLREQERDAWKRLIRVMGHELNNSLAPIQSLAGSMAQLVDRSPKPDGWEEDLSSGLSIIARRSEALGRFMNAYAKLARLPAPNRSRVDVSAWVRRTAALEQRVRVDIDTGPETSIDADADQLDQLLINLLRNAAEAAIETKGNVRVRWSVEGGSLTVAVEDDGPGVAETANLFVPFFTTKPGGSGIGLALARQIAEGHGGDVSLRSRSEHGGAIATVRLPIG